MRRTGGLAGSPWTNDEQAKRAQSLAPSEQIFAIVSRAYRGTM
jgi:hypothetical protein